MRWGSPFDRAQDRRPWLLWFCKRLKLSLGAYAFDYAHPGHGRDDPGQFEAGRIVESTEFCLRALAAAGAHEHVHVIRSCAAALQRLVDLRRIDAFDAGIELAARRI